MKNNCFLCFVVFLFLFSSYAFTQDSLLFIIRVDDILSRNTTIQPRSIVPFEQVIESFGAKVSWAVIPHRLVEPENNDGHLIAELAATVQKGHEVAQHGYNHICVLCGKYHEFYCTTYNQPFTYDQQSAWIYNGKQILQDSAGITPVSFVPPSHVADSTTFKALVDLGFNLISTSGENLTEFREGLFNITPGPDYSWGLTAETFDSQLQLALTDIKRTFAEQNLYTMLFHDPFIRQGYENGLVLQWTAELLDSLQTIYGQRLKFVTLSQARALLLKKTAIARTRKLFLQNFKLSQNYPNPFNGQTAIAYHLDRAAQNVSVRFFDVNGNLIESRNLGHHLPGNYQFKWHPVALASGRYWYVFDVRFNDGRQAQQIKTCIFLK